MKIDSVEPVDRGNHTVWPLLNAKHGLTAGAGPRYSRSSNASFRSTSCNARPNGSRGGSAG